MVICARLAYLAPAKVVERGIWLEAHKAFLRDGRLRILQAGPLFDEEQRQVGALVVAEMASLAEMQAICSEDPFVVHDIYDRVTFFDWRQTIGRASGEASA